MFYCFVGPKGGGKSYGLLQLLIDELRLTNRPIMTNLSVDVCKLQKWVDRQKWGKVIDVAMRITVLTPEQIAEWFLWHPGGRINSQTVVMRAGGGTHEADYSIRANDGGILYIIDEAHIPFPSDRWAAVARDCAFYCTQERKLLDDTIFATQAPDQLAKPLRQLMQEWTETRNMSKEPIIGIRFPGRFRWRMTLRQPDGREQTAINHRVISVDKELRECYNTMAGVGITGKGDPNAERGNRGIRWQFALILGVFAILCIFAGVWFGAKLGFGAIQKGIVGVIGLDTGSGKATSKLVQATGLGSIVPQMSESLSNQTSRQIPPSVQAITPPTFASNETIVVKNNHVEAGKSEPSLYLMGVTLLSGQNRVKVYLSDGSVIDEKDPRLTYVDRKSVIFMGQRLTFAPKKPETERPPQAPEILQSSSVELTRQAKIFTGNLDSEK